MKSRNAFTIIELVVVILVIGILASITVVTYGAWQKRTATTTAKSDLSQATSSLTSFRNFRGSFPPNLAGTGFASSPSIALKLLTDAPSVGRYTGLNSGQNAQLFLNVCNANLAGTTNTSCIFQGSGGGSKIHVKGTGGANTIWNSPICKVAGAGCGSVAALTCGSACTAAVAAMISQFEAQGGTFPVTVSGGTTALPEPTLTPNGAATKYCIESRSGDYDDVVFYSISSGAQVVAGTCPADPSLRYYP